MREPQPITVRLHDLGSECRTQTLLATHDGGHERRRGPRQRRRHRKRLVRRCGQRREPAGDEIEQPLRHGCRSPGRNLRAVPVESRAELKHEKRIAAGHRVQASECRAGKPQAEAALQQLMGGVHAERPDREPLHALGADQWRSHWLIDPLRKQ